VVLVNADTATARAAPTRAVSAQRRADIQGIRAIAVLLVVVYHAGIGLPGGFVGVDIFFAVSGYVITGMLLRELSDNGRISLRRFYLRRARRLLPAMAVMSTATLAMAATLMSPLGFGQEYAGRAASAASTFVANAYFLVATGGYFQPIAATNPFLHTWSLSVEEQFYVAFPVVVLLVWRLRLRRAHLWLLALMVLGLGVSIVACLAFTYGWLPRLPLLRGMAASHGLAMRFAFFSPVTRAWEFLTGVVTALYAARRVLAPRTANRLALIGVVLLVVSTVVIHEDDAFPGALATLPVVGTICLLMAGTSTTATGVTRILSTRPAVALGDVSYSWYLWHWPIILLATLWFPTAGWVGIVAAAGSLVPAILSYRWIERPIHGGRRLIGRRATVLMVVACVALPAAAGSALVSASLHAWGRADLAAIESTIHPDHADILTGCASKEPLGAPARPSCTWVIANPRGTILLIGDSNAGHLIEPMIGAAHELGFNLEVATLGGCPLLRRKNYFSDICQRFVEGSLSAISSRVPAYSAVVISNASVGYTQGPLATNLIADAPLLVAGDEQQRAIAAWAQHLRRTAEEVTARSPLVVVGAIPQFAGYPRCLAPSVLLGPAAGCGAMAADDPRLVHRRELLDAERRALAGKASGYVDTGDRVCTASAGCRAWVNGHLVFRDEAHLSVDGSLIYQQDLRDALGSLAAKPAGNHP
jgi:peptidoglycan/LPS O-acetylase OafA/YrhL